MEGGGGGFALPCPVLSAQHQLVCRFIPLEEAESVITSNGSTLPVRTSGQGLPAARNNSVPADTPKAAKSRDQDGVKPKTAKVRPFRS